MRSFVLNITFQLPALDTVPVEILLHILSYLHALDFFTLKVINRYIYRIISTFPLLPFSDYVTELEAEDCRRGDGRSILGIAASRGQETLVMRLLENQTEKDPEQKKPNPASPLRRVVGQIKWKHGKEKFTMSVRDGSYRSPLHWAAENGQETLVRSLIRKGAPTWMRDLEGKTALDLAVENGHKEVVRLLIQDATRIGDVQSTA